MLEETFEQLCMKFRGEVLTGKYAHCCEEWDGLPVDETCGEEFECCTCSLLDDDGKLILKNGVPQTEN